MISLKNGIAVIEAYCQRAENLPAVYRMINKDNEVIYVGKARQLKKRLMSYTKPLRQALRVQRMVTETAKMEFILTHTEAEALLLEANLIKELKPRYNILLRDDKSFPMIRVRRDHPFPQVLKYRGPKRGDSDYFGPYASSAAVNESLVVLERVFQLRNCADSIFAHRNRPCLQYHIKRCTAPCVDKISQADYGERVAAAKEFLSGGSRVVQDILQRDMLAAAAKRDYEKATEIRDRIQALTKLQQRQTINVGHLNADLVALFRQGGRSCLQLFFYRDGQNHGNRAFFPKHGIDDSDDDIIAAFLVQFYQDIEPPEQILLSHTATDQETLGTALTQIHGKKITLQVPQRGEKKLVMDEALKNARWGLLRKDAEQEQTKKLLHQLATLAQVDHLERIEIYDNSHLQGTNPVGAMVVYTEESGFEKKSYRLYNFNERRGGGDDSAMMREMLTRRLARSVAAEQQRPLPDLIILDGGKPQMTIAKEVLADMGLSSVVPLMAVAKGVDRHAGRERLFFDDGREVALKIDDPLQFFIQRLRDESHRFAIMAHRKKRKKSIERTGLEDVPGIGAKRKQALIRHFGSAQLAMQAGVADLMQVQGISKELAEYIYHANHPQAIS